MEPSLTDTLCTKCGLCCDGSLFADVELAGRAEATRLEVMGLPIDDDDANGALLPQPCSALQGGLCTIYAHRPKCCRTFECRLLQDVRRGAVGVERAGEQVTEALTRIARVQGLLARLGRHDTQLPLRERCAETLAREAGAEPELKREHAELEAAMSSVEEFVRKTFLSRGRPPRAPRHRGSTLRVTRG